MHNIDDLFDDDAGDQHSDECRSNGEDRRSVQQWRVGFGLGSVQPN